LTVNSAVSNNTASVICSPTVGTTTVTFIVVVPPVAGDSRYANREPEYAVTVLAAPDSDAAEVTELTSDEGVALQPTGKLVVLASKLSNAHMCEGVTEGVTVDVDVAVRVELLVEVLLDVCVAVDDGDDEMVALVVNVEVVP